jgi:hypothetical protein
MRRGGDGPSLRARIANPERMNPSATTHLPLKQIESVFQVNASEAEMLYRRRGSFAAFSRSSHQVSNW